MAIGSSSAPDFMSLFSDTEDLYERFNLLDPIFRQPYENPVDLYCEKPHALSLASLELIFKKQPEERKCPLCRNPIGENVEHYKEKRKNVPLQRTVDSVTEFIKQIELIKEKAKQNPQQKEKAEEKPVVEEKKVMEEKVEKKNKELVYPFTKSRLTFNSDKGNLELINDDKKHAFKFIRVNPQKNSSAYDIEIMTQVEDREKFFAILNNYFGNVQKFKNQKIVIEGRHDQIARMILQFIVRNNNVWSEDLTSVNTWLSKKGILKI